MTGKKKSINTIKFSMFTLGLAILISLGLLFFITLPQKPSKVSLTRTNLRSYIISDILELINKIKGKISESDENVNFNLDALNSGIMNESTVKIEDIKGYLQNLDSIFIENVGVFDQGDIDDVRKILINITKLEEFQ